MSRTAITVAPTALFLLVTLVAGCAAPPPSTAVRPDTAAERPNPAAPASNEASSLADQARRDVETFLQMRASAANADSDPADSAPPTDPASAAAVIRWNEPVGSGASEQATAPAVSQPPLATDGGGESSSTEVVEAPDPAPDATASAETQIAQLQIDELIVQLSGRLYREAAYDDMPLRNLLLIAALTMADERRALTADAIPGLTARERELLSAMQTFFVGLGRELDGGRDADEVIRGAVDDLRASLRTEPPLSLPTAALCTRVGGFGSFSPFDRYAFLAHARQQVIVYVEIEHFTSEQNPRGEWVTELAQQLVIYSDRDGIPVWKEDWQSAPDVTRNKRQDFFTVQKITLPEALSVGRYHLKIRVRDEKSGAEAEQSIPFEMVADARLAASPG